MIVSAPCRLHFGLFHVPVEGLTHWPDGRPIRKFGGLGMMVREPRIRVQVTTADIDSAHGPLADRALQFARLLPRTLCYRIEAEGPPEHVGLGVGTALGLSVGTAILGTERFTELPHRLGRGQRSGIGLHGFRCGGFLVDRGKFDQELPEIQERIEFPKSWRIVLARPATKTRWHGEQERSAFARSRDHALALDTTARLLQLAEQRIVPALKSQQLDDFGDAITEFNRLAGLPFAHDQGGLYADPNIEKLLDALIEHGVHGAGQSSWGPTVFAFTKNDSEACELVQWMQAQFEFLEDLTITSADNLGFQHTV